ncbi:MAG: hypothetical protein ATN32_05930, partial [Candidatus Epulonipiscium fishelsonii]
MNTDNLRNSMIEYLQYDEEQFVTEKTELIKILQNSYINFITEFMLSKVTIEIRVKISMLKQAKIYEHQLYKLCRLFVEHHNKYDLNIEIVPAVNEAKQDYAENEILFENIKPKIISQLKIAKYTIWIAVAWFTDIDIYNELIEKKAQGVNIRIITSDELSNRRLLEKLNKFDLVKIPIQGSNRLHNKFCIIDLEYVMHGSYNWSKNAINNKETWPIFKSREMAEEF